MIKLLLKLLAVAGILIVAISGIYLWLIPAVAPGYKTYLVFVAGIVVAAIVGYWEGARYVSNVHSRTNANLLKAGCVIGMIFIVCYGSLFVILNIGGA